MIGGHDKTLATPKEEIIVHPYRPFADPTKDRDREHFELFEKAHQRDFRQNVRNTDNTERPHPDDHHLGPKIGTPKNARATDDTEQRAHPNDHHLGPNIGTPKNARVIDYTGILPHPNGHLLPPKIGTPINARAINNIERPHPNDHHLGPNIGTPKNGRVIDITERPHPNDHHLGPKIGTPKNSRAIDGTEKFPLPNGHFLPPKIGTPINARAIHGTERITRPDGLLQTPSRDDPVGTPIETPIGEISLEDEDVERPHPNDHHLGPMIGTPINTKREESEEPEELGDLEEIPVELPISSDYYPGEFDGPEEIPVDLPISLDYYPDYDPEEFDDLEEEPVDLPILSDYYPEEFDDLEEIPGDLPPISDYYPESSDYEDARYIPETPGDRNVRRPGRLAGPPYPCAGPLHFNGTGFNNTINGTVFNNAINGTAFNNATNITTEAIGCFKGGDSDSEELAEPTLNRRGQGANLERKARGKETKEKNRGSSGKDRPNKSSPNIMDHAPELFDYLKDPFNKPFPYEDDEKISEDFFKNLDKLRHPLYWTPGGDKTEHPKQESGHEWPEKPHPKTSDDKTGFKQGDGWKTDYWQKGVGIQQPRVPQARQPYWTEGNPVY